MAIEDIGGSINSAQGESIGGSNNRARGEAINGSSMMIDHNHPLYLSSSDVPGALSVGIQLTGMENYTLWSRAMEIALLGGNKLGFIDGIVSRSNYDGDLRNIWDRCNAIVISWLTCNVSKELLSGILYSSSVHQVWLDLKERFDKINGSRLHQLHRNIFTLTQGVSTVSAYYTKLKNLWDEYDSILPPPSCDCHKAKEYVEQMQYQCLLQFLMGLNDGYSQARGQILMMHNLPNVNQAYALIIQDESQKGIAGNVYEGMESLALYSAKYNRSQQFDNRQTQYPKENFHSLYCDFCNMKGHLRADCNKLKKCSHCHATGHIKEDCYLLIGYPKNFKGKKKVNTVMGGSSVHSQYQGIQDHVTNQTTKGEHMYNDQITQKQLLQLMSKTTPEQLDLILNVLQKHKYNNIESQGSVNMTGPLVWEGQGDWRCGGWTIYVELES